MWKGSSVVLSQPATYIQLFKQGAFLPAAFNFLLLFPLGVYLRYFLQKRHYWKRVFLIGFSVSLFFEITQLTGLYGIYNCPYRTFNVDDLILNSTGSLAGFLIAPVILALFPSQSTVLAKREELFQNNIVLPIPQLIAIFIDIIIVKISWSIVAIFLSDSFFEVIFKTVGMLVVFVIVPILWKGKTVGSNFMRYRYVNTEGNSSFSLLMIKRLFALSLPWLVYKGLIAISTTKLDMESPLYGFHILISIGSLLAIVVLIIVLLIHVTMVIFSKGDRLFYFDHVSNIVPKYKRVKK